MLQRQIRQLARLVDDLLDVARIRQGKFTLKTTPHDLRLVVQHAIDAVPMIHDKAQRITVALLDSPAMVMADEERLTQVIVNVLGNAAKYTQSGGEISVRMIRRDNEAIVSVRDNGSGIEPELLPKIFDLFRQGERTLHDAQGGLGIGLTLVQRILQLHGGTVEAFSDGRDQGSEFVIRLPIVVNA
jgi:signal transduction histidine kinase